MFKLQSKLKSSWYISVAVLLCKLQNHNFSYKYFKNILAVQIKSVKPWLFLFNRLHQLQDNHYKNLFLLFITRKQRLMILHAIVILSIKNS